MPPVADAAPFDAIAGDYDRAFTDTAVGRLQREVVWRELLRVLETLRATGSTVQLRVLELNCGTGEDAVWLAQQGCRVLATDASAEMVAVARTKAERVGVDVDVRACAFADLGRLPEGDFDLVFSNFGGLNCLPPAGIAALGKILTDKLRPGGALVAVVMGRFCAWETLYFLWKGRFRTAFRRLQRGPVPARLDVRTIVDTWYYSPRELTASFAKAGFSTPAFVRAVGFWLPPSYLNPFFEKRSRMLRGLNWLEKKCRGRFWALGADHFLWRLTR